MLLTENTLRTLAPAAFAETHGMSSKYEQVKTMDVVRRLADAGYVPVDAGQDNPVKRDPNHVTHKVVLRHEDHLVTTKPYVPQIIIMNSHNGRRRLNMMAGVFRFVCLNGMVLGNKMYNFQARHSGNIIEDAFDFTKLLDNRLGEVHSVIDHWSEVELSAAKANELARKAGILRWGEGNAYEPEKLLEARRADDDGRDLWKVFNIVQENCSKGGIEGMNANNRVVRAGALTQIEKNAEFNKQLWDLAAEFA